MADLTDIHLFTLQHVKCHFQYSNEFEYIFKILLDMGNYCCTKRKIKGRIVLLLVGLDNAGKTKAANTLAGDHLNSPVPTVGFSVVNLKYLSYHVKVFDLGGGPNIRAIWNQYFVDAHGIIFVIDSSDYSRFDEAKIVLEDVLRDEKISGKPVLLLANKQDNKNALDEIDIIEYLKIEQLVNLCKCPTLVQSCSASENNSHKLDPGIRKGYEWLMGNIIKNYEVLNKRVQEDVKEQERKEREEMLEKIRRIKSQQELEQKNKDEDAIELYSDYARKLNSAENHHPISDVTTIDYKNEYNDNSSEGSSISFPPVYHTNTTNSALTDRPKSALQIVKHQLQLNNSVRRPSLKSRTNKTAPMNLYEVKLSHSATERQKDFSNRRRNLKSADDCLFTISSKMPINHYGHIKCSSHNQGDHIHINNHEALDKLPSLNVKHKVEPWANKNLNGDNVNVIEID